MKEGDTTYAMDIIVVINCPSCGIPHGIPQKFQSKLRESKATFFCPNGHKQWYGENEADRLRRELAVLKQREAMHEDEKRRLRVARDLAERDKNQAELARADSERRAARVAKRVSRGVCPGCNRTFPNLARHMASKHLGIECSAVQVAAEKKARVIAARLAPVPP